MMAEKGTGEVPVQSSMFYLGFLHFKWKIKYL